MRSNSNRKLHKIMKLYVGSFVYKERDEKSGTILSLGSQTELARRPMCIFTERDKLYLNGMLNDTDCKQGGK